MPRTTQLKGAIARDHRLNAVHDLGESRASLDDIQLRCDVDCSPQIVRSRAEIVGQRQQDAADFFGLLLFERDDVVVDLDRGQRLEKQARAARRCAVDDARDGGAMLGPDNQDVAPVAIRDDLFLQVL